jgi:threonine synthase
MPEAGGRGGFVTHLECSLTGERHEARRLHNLSKAGHPLLVRYDLGAVGRALGRTDLRGRARDMWRYRELLPMDEAANVVSLGETVTPLVPIANLARDRGWGTLRVKDEGRLPTGSFKARGLAVAVGMARELGAASLAIPTAGNAGAALAAYASRAGLKSFVFCPDDAPEVTISEIALHGGRVWRVNGIITDLGPLVERGCRELGWFNVSTLKEPYRVEGKKTMGFELAEQFDWDVPEAIFYPTGGGTGIVGMWKAFDEMQALGWIGRKRPRLVAVQSETCAPIVRAFERGAETAEPVVGGHTDVPGLRVPFTIGDRLVLRALRATDGFGVTIRDDEIEPMRRALAAADGIHLCPEGAATLVAYDRALRAGRVSRADRVVLFNCASGLKYPLPKQHRRLDRHRPIDFRALTTE